MAMESEHVKTPAQLAEEARQTGRDAVEAAQGYAAEARRVGAEAVESIRPSLEDARATGREGLDTVRGLANDARDIAGDAAATGRAYAKDAVNAAGRKLHDAKDQFDHARQACVQYIADEPVKAALISAAAGAVLTTLALSLLRGRRRD
jgi:ElaB/YqjD/DUF883 family membrane-anchored ribosome-binding protein